VTDGTDTEVLQPYDFAQMAASLVDTFPSAANRRWLEQSWKHPDSYRAALFARAAGQSGAFKSRTDGGIDAYHDLVQANTGKQRTALVYSSDGESIASLSYDALHTACVALGEAWRAQGVEAGDTLAVLTAPGPSRVAAIMAGLRLGLQVSVVEPRGRRYVQNRLRLLDPAHIAGGHDVSWYASEREPLPLSMRDPAQAPRPGGSHSYAADEPMLTFCSPLAEGEEALCHLTAIQALSAILSDALLLLPIRPGERVAAPGRDRTLIEPALMLATFAAGGSFVDLDMAQCRRTPALLADAGIEVVLASPDLCDLVLSQPDDLTSSWKRWFLDPTARMSWEPWAQLAERLRPRGVACSKGIYIAAFGGTLALAPKTLAPDPLRIVPAPGVAWSLRDVSGIDSPVPLDNGVLAVEGFSAAQVGTLMVSGSGLAYGLGGSLQPLVDGRPYPVQEVVSLAQEHPLVAHAAVVVVPDGTVMNHGRSALLLFVAPLWEPQSSVEVGQLRSAAQDLVDTELGPHVRPDSVEVYRLSPRLRDGLVDPVWVRGQYLTGMLSAKRSRTAFVTLARLRQLFALDAESS